MPNEAITPNRAIALAGGGPAAALHIGALEFLREKNIKFDQPHDVWALSCIGAWVGIYYNQCDYGEEIKQTKQFFREKVYRDDLSYSRFPINAVFGPDIVALSRAATEFLVDIENYQHIVLPSKMVDFVRDACAFVVDPNRWNQGDLSKLALEFCAAHPVTRFMTSMMYQSSVNGLAKMYYKNSSFLKSIKFEELRKPDKPFIFHNAFNLSTKKVELFANRTPPDKGELRFERLIGTVRDTGVNVRTILRKLDERKSADEILHEHPELEPEDIYEAAEYRSRNLKYQPIDASTLCACSALPYIEETVRFEGGAEYCEGALVDTVNFFDLVTDHPDIDEIWVSKIVEYDNINAPKNMCDALGNLCMLFAATVGDDDIRLFKYHSRLEQKKPWLGEVVEIDFGLHTNFDWSHTNFDAGIEAGRKAAEEAWQKYQKGEFRREAERARDKWRKALPNLGRFNWEKHQGTKSRTVGRQKP